MPRFVPGPHFLVPRFGTRPHFLVPHDIKRCPEYHYFSSSDILERSWLVSKYIVMFAKKQQLMIGCLGLRILPHLSHSRVVKSPWLLFQQRLARSSWPHGRLSNTVVTINFHHIWLHNTHIFYYCYTHLYTIIIINQFILKWGVTSVQFLTQTWEFSYSVPKAEMRIVASMLKEPTREMRN